MPAFSQARLKRRRAASKYSFSRIRTLGIGLSRSELGRLFYVRRPPKGKKRPMRILAIESSCDESAVAFLDEAQGLLAHELWSQIDLHRAFGGVVPELASRDHVRRLLPMVRAVVER